MIKLFTLFVIMLSSLMATSYNFSETRYSDAFDESVTLNGEISFLEDGLSIKYNNRDKALHYEKGDLSYLQNGESVKISEEEATRIIQYFEIIILLYSGDEDSLNREFSVTKEKDRLFLTPLNEMKKYISKIELKKEDKQLKMIKLFLSNSDNITISIEDEIR